MIAFLKYHWYLKCYISINFDHENRLSIIILGNINGLTLYKNYYSIPYSYNMKQVNSMNCLSSYRIWAASKKVYLCVFAQRYTQLLHVLGRRVQTMFIASSRLPAFVLLLQFNADDLERLLGRHQCLVYFS